MSVSLTFNCDGCGKSSAGVSPSVYSPPPLGWIWATQQGPHACGERCWWHVETAHKGRTGQSLEAISHDSVEVVEEDEPAPPTALAVRAQPARTVLVPEVVVEEEEEPPARPVRTAKPAAKQAKPASKSKIVPLVSPDACVQCGGEMPPRGPGRFPRTRCYDCQPKRERAS